MILGGSSGIYNIYIWARGLFGAPWEASHVESFDPTPLTHLKSLEEVHHLEDMGSCLHIIKSAMKNTNAALHM